MKLKTLLITLALVLASPALAQLDDQDEDGFTDSTEIACGSNPSHAESTCESDDDGDGTTNEDEAAMQDVAAYCTGAYGIVVGPECGGYAAPTSSGAPCPDACVDDQGRTWVWDSVCRPERFALGPLTGQTPYAACMNGNYELNEDLYEGGVNPDGYGWRRVADAPSAGEDPVIVPTTGACNVSESDGDGVPTFSVCSSTLSVYPNGTTQEGPETVEAGPYGDPDDDDPEAVLPIGYEVTFTADPGLVALVDTDVSLSFEKCGNAPTGFVVFTATPDDGNPEPINASPYQDLTCGEATATWTPTVPGSYTLTALDGNDEYTISYEVTSVTAPDNGNGNVDNVAPVASQGLSCDVGVVPNTQTHVETCTFRAYDANTEADYAEAQVTSTAGWTATLNTFTPGQHTVPEGTWTVTDDATGDGVLDFSFSYTWPEGQAAGLYEQTGSISDEAETATAPVVDQTQFQTASEVMLDPFLYDEDGNVVAGHWGQWTTTPGATDVDSLNFRRSENPGTEAGTIVLAFTDSAFSDGGSGAIPIDGNLAFCLGYGATPATDMTCGAADSDGQASFQVPPGGEAWFGYRLLLIPSEVPDGTYGAGYTFTDL